MKASSKIFLILLPVWYWIAVVNISTYFKNKSTEYYIKSTEAIINHDIKDGFTQKATAELYSKKAKAALTWIPKFARP